MPQSEANSPKRRPRAGPGKSKPNRQGKIRPRYSVGLPPTVASQVERYAETVDTSMSKAIGALVRLGLESQADRKREFFKRLKANLANNDSQEEDRMVDEFRALILGR